LPGGWWKQEFTPGAVLAVTPFGAVLAFQGVAADATVRTGVVGADIARGAAVAFLAGRFRLGGNGTPGHVAEVLGVDALRFSEQGLAVLGPVGGVDQFGLPAKAEGYSVGGGGIGEGGEEVALFVSLGVAPREPQAPAARSMLRAVLR